MITMESRKIVSHPRPLARPKRLSEEVSNLLRQRIEHGELQPGSRLPTENALSTAFGVSRAVIREAVARLKAEGMVETRQGSGAYVAAAPPRLNLGLPHDAPFSSADLHDIFELRAVVEGAVAELAAQRRTRRDITALRRHLAAMAAALAAGGDGAGADDAFHVAIAAATGNAYVGKLVEFLGRHFSAAREVAWSNAAALPHAALQEHKALFDAISTSDPIAARRAALDHLYAAADRLGIKLSVELRIAAE